MRAEWWSRARRATTGLGLALAASACGSGATAAPVDGGIPIEAGNLSQGLEAGSEPDASNAPDALADAGSPCSPDASLAASGDYAGSDGTQYWLRQSPTAATFTVVPPGTPSPASPPSVGRIQRICGNWLGVVGSDGSTTRLDWATVTGGLLLCQRAASSLDTVTSLAAADAADADAGCSGAPWLSLSAVTP